MDNSRNLGIIFIADIVIGVFCIILGNLIATVVMAVAAVITGFLWLRSLSRRSDREPGGQG